MPPGQALQRGHVGLCRRARPCVWHRCRRPAPPLAGSSGVTEDRPGPPWPRGGPPRGPGTPGARRRLARLSAGSQEAEGVLPSPGPWSPRVAERGGRSCPSGCPGACTGSVPVTEGLLSHLRPHSGSQEALLQAQSAHTTGTHQRGPSAPLQGRGPGRPVSAEALTEGSLLCGDTERGARAAEGGTVQAASGHRPGRPQRPAHRREPSLPASEGRLEGPVLQERGDSDGAGALLGMAGHRWSSRGRARR